MINLIQTPSMMIILYFLIGCILYAAYLFLIVLYGNLDTTDVSDEKFGETLKNVASLSGPLRARVEGLSMFSKRIPT